MIVSWDGVRRFARRGLRIAGLLAIAGGVFYWIKLAPLAALGHRIERGEIVAEVVGTGTLEAQVQTVISSKISGRISKVLADQGDRVSADQLLVRLDDEELRQQVAIAQASKEAAAAAVARLHADKERAAAVFEQAAKNHERVAALFSKKSVSRDDLDRAIEALAVAQAGTAHAEAAITEGQKQLTAADKNLEYHRARLADTEIKAPFAGLIVRRTRDPGDVVVPGSTILALIATDVLWISAWVDETEIARLTEGQPARVVFRSEPERSYPGQIVRLGREADRETREFVVDVEVVQLPRNWAVGQRAEVYIETARKPNAALLPARFVTVRDGRQGVFVDAGGRAEWRPVTIGLSSPDWLEVVAGVEPEDTIVVPADPRDDFSDGRRIAVP